MNGKYVNSSFWAGWFREVAVGSTERWWGMLGRRGSLSKETFHSWIIVLIGIIIWGRWRKKSSLFPKLCTLCHRVSGEPLEKAGEGLGQIQQSGNSQNPVAVWLSTSREMWAVCFWLLRAYHIRLFFIGSSFISKKPVCFSSFTLFRALAFPSLLPPASPLTPSPLHQLLPV